MTDQPARVSLAEISFVLDELHPVPPTAPLAALAACQMWKAELLSRLAAQVHTPEAYRIAADAWSRACALLTETGPEVAR